MQSLSFVPPPSSIVLAARYFLRLLVLSSLLVSAACGGTEEEDSSGDERLLTELEEEDLGTLCDEVADSFGGYDVTIDCGEDFSVSSPENRAACVGEHSNLPDECQATVEDVRTCREAFASDCSVELSCAALSECGLY